MSGRIEVITGGMFSGKSEELVRRLRRATYARKSVLAVKHATDDRYHPTSIGSHSGALFDAQAVSSLSDLGDALKGVEVLGIDEAQFFGPEITTFCEKAATTGIRVIVAGLDLYADGRPFGQMSELLSLAEDVTKLHAICMVCGLEASRTYYKGTQTNKIEVGVGQYEARCRECWALQDIQKGIV